MALYPGEEMVTVTGPDGITRQLPASVAQSLQFTAPPDYNGGGGGGGFNIGPAPMAAPITGPEIGGVPSNNPQDYAMPPPPEPNPAPWLSENIQPSLDGGAGPSPVESILAKQSGGAPPMVDSAAMPQGAPMQPPAPQGAPPTTANDLRQTGFAGVYDQTNAALADAADAGVQVANAEAEAQNKMADAYAQQSSRIDALQEARVKEAEKQLAAQDRKGAEIDALAEKYANTKIDRESDHPILNWIGIIMAGLGSAMKGEGDKNPAMDAMYRAIDRKVAGQMSDLDKQGKVIGLHKDSLDNMRKVASDREAFRNTLIKAESDRTSRLIQEITARSSSDIVKAKGSELIAGLRIKSAEARGVAVQQQTNVDQQMADRKQQDIINRRNVGVDYARIKEGARQHNDQIEMKKAEIAADIAKSQQNMDAQGRAAQDKLIQEYRKENESKGMYDAGSGEAILQPEGEQKVEQAKKMDEDAAKLEAELANLKPEQQQAAGARVQALRQAAAGLRVEANTKDVWRVGNETLAPKIKERYSSTQASLTTVDQIKQLTKDHGGLKWLKTSEGKAMISSKAANLSLLLKEAYNLGVLNGPDIGIITDTSGGDPTKINWNRAVGELTNGLAGEDGDAIMARMNSMADSIQTKLTADAKVNGFRGNANKLFKRMEDKPETAADKAIKETFKGETPGEASKDPRGGVVREGIIDGPQNFARVIKGAVQGKALGEINSLGDDRERAAASGGHERYLGLNKKQGDTVRETIWSINRAKDDPKAKAEVDRSRAMLVEQVVQNAKTRPDLSRGMLEALAIDAPDLYQQARGRLPQGHKVFTDTADEYAAGNHNVGPAAEKQAPTDPVVGTDVEVANWAVTGDQKSFDELARRATANPKLKPVLDAVIQRRSSFKK